MTVQAAMDNLNKIGIRTPGVRFISRVRDRVWTLSVGAAITQRPNTICLGGI
jgi:hypothetical protein